MILGSPRIRAPNETPSRTGSVVVKVETHEAGQRTNPQSGHVHVCTGNGLRRALLNASAAAHGAAYHAVLLRDAFSGVLPRAADLDKGIAPPTAAPVPSPAIPSMPGTDASILPDREATGSSKIPYQTMRIWARFRHVISIPSAIACRPHRGS